jgi:hypothetical protein
MTVDDGAVGSGSEVAQRKALHHSTVNELLRLTLREHAVIQSIVDGDRNFKRPHPGPAQAAGRGEGG